VYQEKEGPGIARSILVGLGAKGLLIDAVCDIIGHHHSPGSEENLDFKAVYDADGIANIEDQLKIESLDPSRISEMIEKSFLTDSGKETARDVLL
jgi:hypothetical protein